MKQIKQLATLILILLSIVTSAQVVETPSYLSVAGEPITGSTLINAITSGNNINITQGNKLTTSNLRERNESANLYLKLDFGENYVAIEGTYKLEVDVEITHPNFSTTITKKITVTDVAPEMLTIINLLEEITALNNVSTTVPLQVNISNINIDNGDQQPLPDGLLKNYINENIRLTANLVREYAVDVRNSNTELVAEVLANPTVHIVNRLATFSWIPPAGVAGYPNYEIQILRLYNTDTATQAITNTIKTSIDWRDALKVETQSYQTNITLTLAEGTGFYIWRVRPIGNYFTGGIANGDNYGQWNNSYQNGDNIEPSVPSVAGNFNLAPGGITHNDVSFYFKDPDEDINWVYNRVFTEGNNNLENEQGTRTSEGISYADGLLRTRQTQAYNSSNQTTLVTQTIPDYSGRPALTTIPVPVNNGLSNYKVGFVQNQNGQVYTALDFDENENANNPTQVNNSNFDYYSGNQVTLNSGLNNEYVADAEGFPFKRTLFKPDGTGRVTEESGVGKRHALGAREDNRGRTTRVLFGSPSDYELIRIFGDEAPLSESVIKTVTIDPNDVISVTYTSKEGNTIATALITSKTEALDSLERPIEPLTIHNIANQNVLSNQRLVSTKRIVVETPVKDITLNYQVIGGTQIGGCAGGNCNFKVRFSLTNAQTGETYVSDADENTPITIEAFAYEVGTPLEFPANWKWVKKEAPSTPEEFPITGNNNNQFQLPEGEYIITKEIFSTNESNFAEALTAEATERLQPILEVLANKMASIANNEQYQEFIEFIEGNATNIGLKGRIDIYQLNLTQATSDEVYTYLELDSLAGNPEKLFPEEFSFEGITDPFGEDPADNTQNTFSFNLTCCGPIDIPVPKPEICLPCEAINGQEGANFDGIDKLREENPNNTYFLNQNGEPDATTLGYNELTTIVDNHFMSLLYNRLEEENFIVGYVNNELNYIASAISNPTPNLINTFERVAPGFTPETLRNMLVNMLASRYYTKHALEFPQNTGTTYYRAEEKEDGTLQYVDSEGNFIENPTINGVVVTGVNDANAGEFNYNCKDLYNCWFNTVNLINGFNFDGDANIMNTFNDEEGDNASENHYDDDENSDGPGGILGWFTDLVISVKMRRFQNSPNGEVPQSRLEALVNLPNRFLACAGYQFAKILDEDEALPADYTNTPNPTTLNPSIIISSISPFLGSAGHGTEAPGLFITELNNNQPPTATFDRYFTECPTADGGLAPEQQLLQYKYILKPQWMFKYFVYNAFDIQNSSIGDFDDNNPILLNQFEIEVGACYNDLALGCGPNAVELLCSGNTCNYYHKNWSAGQRLNFFRQIRGGLNCPPTPEDITPLGQLVAPTKEVLITSANNRLDEAVNTCENRRIEFRNTLVTELNSKCYTLVECTALGSPNYEISEIQINQMVEQVVQECIHKVEEVRLHLPQINETTGLCVPTPQGETLGYGCNIAPSEIAGTTNNSYPTVIHQTCNSISIDGTCETNIRETVFLFAPCDIEVINQVTFWEFQPNLNVPTDLPNLVAEDGVSTIDVNEDGVPDKCINEGIARKWVGGCPQNAGCASVIECTHIDNGVEVAKRYSNIITVNPQ